MMSRIYSLIALLIISSAQLLAYDPNIVNVHINSGNPRFPFPQFLDYKCGKTLGRDNAIGVTDIEMEKTTREAYQIMMNRAVYNGTVVSGTKYITFNPIGHGFTGPEPDVSEGDGYALLAAAYMADKPTFDGIYMYVHDAKGSVVELFSKCGTIRNSTYEYGKGTIGWKIGDNDAAADGDFDIALALMVAYRQWPTEGITDECGKKHTYKDLFISYLKTISDTVFFNVNDGPTNRILQNCGSGTDGWYSGDIGFDGYVKSGNTWVDASGSGTGHTWGSYTFCSRATGQKSKWFDYIAPSYFKAFADFLETEDPVKYAWNIYQFRRAEASSDWLMGQLHAQGKYPTAGTMDLSGSSVSFMDANPAEDARNPWRTILNYVWHGDPSNTWDPVAQEIIPNKPNSFERNNAIRFAELANGWKTSRCMKLGNDPTDLMFGGVATIGTDINTTDGKMNGGVGFHINWNLGSGAAAITANHFLKNNDESKLLLAHWYRQLELMWDGTDEKLPFPDNRYINSLPKYFHGWFRVLGLLVTTGNYQSPEFMSQPIRANVKVYHAVNKTLAFAPTVINGVQRTAGDYITHTFSYRNYASVAANGVSISYNLPSEVEFVSASNGGTYSAGKVVWNLGTIPGYKSTGETGKNWKTFDPTKYETYGTVTITVRVKSGAQNTRICNQPTITATNSAPHTSNEYPNNVTPTMERNCVDIRARSLEIVKRSNRTSANDGDVIDFTIEFQNSSKVGWLNGGRPDVRMTYGNGFPGDYTVTNYFRLLHGAQEAYINTGNYRVSYFINDPARLGLLSATNPNGWFMQTTILEGGDPKKVKFSSQQYTFGEDAIGKWNQRLIMQFADTLMPTTQHSNMFFAKDGEPNEVIFVHKGIASPFRMAVQMEARGAAGSGCGSMPIKDMLTDDWSYTTEVNVGMNDKSLFTPISPGWFDPLSTYDESLQVPIKEVHVEACSPIPTSSFDRVLVEEWDGYLWRRILGNGPVPGREIQNVCIRDTLPKDIVFQGFINAEALGIDAQLIVENGYQIIEWCAPSLLPGANGRIKYSALAKTDCSSDINLVSKAWIYSDSDSPIDSTVKILITCKDLPPLPPNKSSIYKTADKKVYKVDEVVTYNIAFKQSDGTIAEPAMTSTADWKAICGTTMPSSFVGMKNASIIYEYSHGTNGELRATAEPKIEMPFSLLFRNDGTSCTSGLRLEMKVNNCAQLTLNLYENGTLLTSRKDLPVASPATKLDIRIKLDGSKLFMWVNNDNALPYVLDGITYIKPGYVGFQSPAWEAHTLSKWYTNFDSGFEVSLKDYLPSEVDFIASSQTVLFDQNGLYKKPITYDAATRNLNWTLATGKTPMLFGDSVSFTFKAKVATCGPGFIANVVYANLRGVPTNFYGAQSLVTCNKSCTPPTSVKITSDKQSVCPGKTATITAEAEPTGSWVYKISGAATPAYSAVNTFSVGKGTYTITAADATDPASCFLESAPITIAEIADPSVKISSATSICIGTPGNIPLSVTPAGTAGIWKFDGTTGTSFPSAGLAAGTYELIIDASAGGCPFADTVAFTVVETPEPAANGPYSVLFGTANPLMEISAATGATAGWFASASNYPGSPIVSTATYTSPESAIGKYTYYIGQKKDGCWSKPVTVPFEITDCPLGKLVVPTTAICMVNGKATFDVSTVPINLAGADSYKWYDLWGFEITSNRVYTGQENEMFVVRAWSDQYKCYSQSASAMVLIKPEPAASVSLGATVCDLVAKEIGASPATGGTWEYSLDGLPFSNADIDAARDGLTAGQPYELAWKYTETGGCAKSGTQNFTVNRPAKPTAKDISATEQTLPHADLEATGTGDITWYSDECLTAVATGAKPGLQFTKTTDLWLSQEIGGCRSECVKMTVTIDKCGISAPVVAKADQRICVGSALPMFSAIASAGLTYSWSDASGTVAGATHLIQGSLPGTYTATVTASDGTCTSAGTPVSLSIETPPNPEIVAPASVCSGASSFAQFDPAPEASSTFTIDRSAALTGTDLGQLPAGSHALSYTYTSAAGCSGTADATVSVVLTAAPQAGAKVEIVSANPNGKLNATESVNWYGPDDKTKFLITAASYTHPDVAKPGTWKYYTTRTADGCESAPAVFSYQITNCRMPAPPINAPAEICAGSGITLTADKADTANKVSWYTSAGVFIADGPTLSLSSPPAGKHTYIATQTGTCEGAQSTFEFSSVSIAAPTVTLPASAEICAGEPAPAFFGTAGIGTRMAWYAGSGASGALQNNGSALSLTAQQYSVGINIYSIIANRILASGETCKSPATDISFTVKPRPAAPQVAPPPTACFGEAPLAAGAATGNSGLRWFLDAKLNNEIPATAGQSYTPGQLFSSTSAYVASEENGCLGAGTEVTFNVYPFIQTPEILDHEACHDGAMPVITATNVKPGWTAQWQKNDIGAWSSDPLVAEPANASYRMRFEGAGGCKSKPFKFSFRYVNPPVPVTSVTPARLCLGNGGSATVRVTAAGQYEGFEALYPGGAQSTDKKVFTVYAEKKYAGSYTARTYITMQDGRKCWSTASAPASLEVIDHIPAPSAPDVVACEYEELMIVATKRNAGDTLYLALNSYGTDTIKPLAGTTFDIGSYAGTGTNTFYLWAENGCPSDKVPVIATKKPAPEEFSITVGGKTYKDDLIIACQGAAAPPEVKAYSLGSMLEWRDLAGSPAGTGTNEAVLALASTDQGADYPYTLHATANGCTSEKTYIYRVNPLPSPVITAQSGQAGSDTLCVHAQYRVYSIADYTAPDTYRWLPSKQGLVRLDPGAGGEKSPMRAVPLATGIDTLQLVQTVGGCPDTAEIKILIMPRAEASGNVVTDPMGGRALLYNTTPAIQVGEIEIPQRFEWTLDGQRVGQSQESYSAGAATVWRAYPGDRSAWLAAYNSGGAACADSARIDFYMAAVTGLFPPSALSPRSNGSPVSVWAPAGHGLAKYEVWVYDYWGNLVWYSNKLQDGSPAEGWNGRDANGNIIGGDMFTYRIRAEFTDGSKWKNSEGKEFGSIFLIK